MEEPWRVMIKSWAALVISASLCHTTVVQLQCLAVIVMHIYNNPSFEDVKYMQCPPASEEFEQNYSPHCIKHSKFYFVNVHTQAL